MNDSHGHSHSHGHHHGMVHEPAGETLEEYAQALAEARPHAGGRIVRVELEARETDWEFTRGKRTRAWSYNGQIPGPVIDARVGDLLEVQLTNSLPESTMIHWHGMRLPASMDGTENVQHPVQPGETFIYRFVLQDAGTFWYHPHINETVQLEHGLYGALIVREDGEPQLDNERVLVLDDVALDDSGQIERGGSWLEQHDGREGGLLLISGKNDLNFEVSGGQIERWRIINAASARYVRLSMGGVSFVILGTDGGLINEPFVTDEVLLTPGDRIDIAVGPFQPGKNIDIVALPYDRGALARSTQSVLGRVTVSDAKPSRARIPNVLRNIEPLADYNAQPTRVVKLGYQPTSEAPAFTINDESHHRAEPVKLGELQIWDVVNESALDHPFHLHGFFFQVIGVNGRRPPYLSWEDTVNVPAKGSVRIAWLPNERPGEWMYHCHILEHHAGGMMAHFQVIK